MQADKFNVPANLNGRKCNLQVSVKPTTDDADTYVCSDDGEDITQLRKDSGRWKQLWGNLTASEVAMIGDAIDKILLK